MKLIESFAITLNLEEILDLLRGGNKLNKKQPTRKMLDLIDQLQKEAMMMIYPKGIYDIFPSKELQPSNLFNLSEKTVLAICTITNQLENYATKIINNGELSKGIIFDTIASHAAEEVAKQMTTIIIQQNLELFETNKYTHRFSPGYCRWNIEEGQKLIFSSLDTKLINVQLTSSYMMIPRKSISFAINIGKEVEIGLGEKECSTCNFECDYRSE